MKKAIASISIMLVLAFTGCSNSALKESGNNNLSSNSKQQIQNDSSINSTQGQKQADNTSSTSSTENKKQADNTSSTNTTQNQKQASSEIDELQKSLDELNTILNSLDDITEDELIIPN
ncbi:hypothetical protein RBG61_04950 [Paludicola sp. MB14-C6]|uniref:hypothetical protein n=1 Tax=Paludihabitans sp. MB14-C6 TaxID=3070656 RepID=UPI0027DE2326|nr:hypothetical protein [Paludicola sp. MB14-C6]WMJ24021.1 hypothetical protein RBG61_04950 [Paludicola sp. MB14-C6]